MSFLSRALTSLHRERRVRRFAGPAGRIPAETEGTLGALPRLPGPETEPLEMQNETYQEAVPIESTAFAIRERHRSHPTVVVVRPATVA
jgi:hypothetical protein